MTDNETLGTFLIALGTLIKNKAMGGLVDDSMMGLANMAIKEEEAISQPEPEVTDTGISLNNIETTPIELPASAELVKPDLTSETEYTKRIKELEAQLQQKGIGL